MTSTPRHAATDTRALVPVLIYLGLVVAVVSSLGAPLVPTIAAATHVSLTAAQWSLTISLLVGAVATPAMGRLGDGPRRREVVLTALVVVTAGCVLAALPLSFGWLLAGRGLMGVGLGLTPLAMGTARDVLQGERSRSTVAMLSITTVAGVGLGYPLTGVIAEVASFRAAFWAGAVVAFAALVSAALVLPSSRHRPSTRLDVVGAVLLGAAVAGLLLALSEVESWSTVRLAVVVAVSVVLLVLWVGQELRVEHPLVDLRLVRDRTVLAADVTGLMAGVGMYVLMSMVIRYVQTPSSQGYGFGASVVVAGFALLPMSVASVLSSRVMAPVSRRFGPQVVLPVGCLLFVAAEVLFAVARGSLWQVFVVMAVAGLGVGSTFSALPALVVSAVPPAETGSAMSFNQVLRYIGFSAGSALSATVLEAHTSGGSPFPSDRGYTVSALLGVGLLLVAAVLAALLPPRRTRVEPARPARVPARV
ncbi:MAG: transporter [Frankiales bacterium]|nr:transporter [Frankiales bacterium]